MKEDATVYKKTLVVSKICFRPKYRNWKYRNYRFCGWKGASKSIPCDRETRIYFSFNFMYFTIFCYSCLMLMFSYFWDVGMVTVVKNQRHQKA